MRKPRLKKNRSKEHMAHNAFRVFHIYASSTFSLASFCRRPMKWVYQLKYCAQPAAFHDVFHSFQRFPEIKGTFGK